MGVTPTSKALEIAEEQGLDLVEISPNAEPPVCKVMDYKKFVYEQKKREKVMKAKATKVIVKEIRFGPNTDDHDYDFKKKHAIKFLEEGAKLKAYVFFKGRSIIYKDQEIHIISNRRDLNTGIEWAQVVITIPEWIARHILMGRKEGDYDNYKKRFGDTFELRIRGWVERRFIGRWRSSRPLPLPEEGEPPPLPYRWNAPPQDRPDPPR